MINSVKQRQDNGENTETRLSISLCNDIYKLFFPQVHISKFPLRKAATRLSVQFGGTALLFKGMKGPNVIGCDSYNPSYTHT